MMAAQADLNDVIFAGNLTRLKQGLSEICELKEKVLVRKGHSSKQSRVRRVWKISKRI
jgi:hypothetical protein